MDEVLVAEGVRKSYGDTVALDGVSLSVGAGEVFGLIGPNGAGKTTLVRSLTGTTDHDGRVDLFGTDPSAVDRARVGLLPQSFGPPERLTVRELIDYYAGLYDEARDPDEVVAEVGLADAADTWYENLSGGQQRRACVGVSLVNDPDLLFLDEPTTGIDPAGRRDLWDLVDDLTDRGKTVFLTSHSMDEVERLADRVALLRDGRVEATGTPAELVTEYGGEPRLFVTTDAETAAAREALAEAGADFDVDVAAEQLVVSGVVAEDIGLAVRALEDAGVVFESFTWSEPTLEDVYLELTGEAFEGDTRAVTGGAR